MLFFPLPSINIAAKPSPETPLVAGDFLAVGFIESTVMEQPDGGCHVTHTVAKTIQRTAGQNIQAHKRELHKLGKLKRWVPGEGRGLVSAARTAACALVG